MLDLRFNFNRGVRLLGEVFHIQNVAHFDVVHDVGALLNKDAQACLGQLPQ
ncbi:MAG: hypothetical protein WC202_05545 [Desulfobacterales bacterium]